LNEDGKACDELTGYDQDIKSRVTTNWDSYWSGASHFDFWNFSDADVRAEFYIAELETSIVTYIDYSDIVPNFKLELF